MTSSFAAQNHGSRNAHQNPVKSHKGGYLRCPFHISASYAELAEKRVREDMARGGGARGGGAAVADRDGMLLSSSSSHRLADGGDGVETNDGRPWSRAGVGAGKLSSKEKRMQQEQAEHIYGRGSMATSADDAASGTAALSHGPSQENMFAVDTREQAALQQVVPRAVREKVKRRRFEEVRQGRVQLGQHHASRSEREEATTPRHGSKHEEAATTRPPPSATPTAHSAASSQRGSPVQPADAQSGRSPRQAPAAPPAEVQPMSSKPKNRMQMLDDLRSSALLGKKRKR